MAAKVEATASIAHEVARLSDISLGRFEGIGKLQGGQAVIVVGNREVGKSTLINLLAGVKLRVVYEDDTGRTFIDADAPLAAFPIGRRPNDETTIPNKWVDSKGVFYWECPNREDLQGVAQEIAHVIWTRKVFEVFEKIKVLLVVNDEDLRYQGADRIVSIVENLCQLFLGEIEQIKHSIALVVSHAEDNRTERHIKAAISKMGGDFKTTRHLSKSRIDLLESLLNQPITIFKRPSPQSRDLDTTVIKEELLANIEKVKYTAKMAIIAHISFRYKDRANYAYGILVEDANREGKRFAELFKQSIHDVAVSYLDMPILETGKRQNAQAQLKNVLSQLQALHEYTLEETSDIITICIEIVKTFLAGNAQSIDLMKALARIKVIHALEQFVDRDFHVPLRMFHCIQDHVVPIQTTVGNALRAIERPVTPPKPNLSRVIPILPAVPPIPPTVVDIVPNRNIPWQFSPEVAARLQVGAEATYAKIRITPDAPEYRFIQACFEHSAPENRIISEVWCIHNPDSTRAFESHISTMVTQAANSVFRPNWRREPNAHLRDATHERWQQIAKLFNPFKLAEGTQSIDTITLLPLWHGTSPERAESVCNAGFTFFGLERVDLVNDGQALFGNGMYFTNSAKYASFYSPSGNLLLGWVTAREPYPVISDRITIPPDVPQDVTTLRGSSARGNYNAHYIPVIATNPHEEKVTYYPCVAEQFPEFDELVVFQPVQTLLRFWVKIDLALIRNPSLLISGATIQELSTEILRRLEREIVHLDFLPQFTVALERVRQSLGLPVDK